MHSLQATKYRRKKKRNKIVVLIHSSVGDGLVELIPFWSPFWSLADAHLPTRLLIIASHCPPEQRKDNGCYVLPRVLDVCEWGVGFHFHLATSCVARLETNKHCPSALLLLIDWACLYTCYLIAASYNCVLSLLFLQNNATTESAMRPNCWKIKCVFFTVYATVSLNAL